MPCLVEDNPASAAASEGSSEYEDSLPEVPELFRFYAELFPSRVNVCPKLGIAAPAPVDDSLWTADDRGANLHLRVEDPGCRVEVPIRESGKQALDRVNVLLRHRLLRQSCGFEGFPLAEVPLSAQDFSASQ